jgi:predicted Zn-dependent peptidase
MVVSSGVEFSNIDAAIGEIHAQLREIKSGNVTEWELTSAKRAIVTGVATAMDTIGGLEDMYFDSTVATVPYDPQGLASMIEAVTLRDVLDIASGVEEDTTFILTGDK